MADVEYGTAVQFDSYTEVPWVCRLTDTKCVVFGNGSSGMSATVGTITGTSLSWGTTLEVHGYNKTQACVDRLDDTHVIITYKNNSNDGVCVIGTISGTSISVGSEYAYDGGTINNVAVSSISSSTFVVSWGDDTAKDVHSAIGTISGSSISYGSTATADSHASGYNVFTTLLDSTHFALVWQDAYGTSTDVGKSIVGVISGTNISFGSVVNFDGTYGIPWDIKTIDSTHFIVSYNNTSWSGDGTVKIGTVASGDVITYGSAYEFNSAATQQSTIAMLDSTHFVVAYEDDAGSDYGQSKLGTISNDDEVSFGNEVQWEGAAAVKHPNSCSIDGEYYIIVYQYSAAAGKGIVGQYASIVGPVNLKTFNGVAAASVKTIDGTAIASVKSINTIV